MVTGAVTGGNMTGVALTVVSVTGGILTLFAMLVSFVRADTESIYLMLELAKFHIFHFS